jgi:hypothetical protein
MSSIQTSSFVMHVQYPWLVFHKVMRAFRYSLRHGKPYLLNLNDLTQWKIRKYDFLAVPVDCHLLLREWWYIPLNRIKLNITCCFRIQILYPHVRMAGITWRSWRDELARAKEAIANLGDNNTPLQGVVFKTHRCSHCPTELSIEVQPRKLFQGRMNEAMERDPYIVIITSYKDYGACESPDEMEWRYQGPHNPRGLYTTAFPPFVKNRPTDPSVERISLNVPHLEPISAKFER